MKLVIKCECGEEETFALKLGDDPDRVKLAAEKWQSEHARRHEKDGDHDDRKFTTEVELW